MRQIIKNGTIVTGSGSFPADILIDGEKIAATGTAEEIKKLAQPGDFDLEVAGTVTADDFATGTKAALKGGTTTIIDFGTQYPGETLAEGLKNWHEKADGKCSCDYSFHMSITDWNPSVSKEVQDMMDEGITSFKLYMTYDTQVDDKTLFEILQRLKETGGITGVHCENSGMIAALQEEAKAAGKMGVSSHPKTRPVAAEAEAIGRLLRLAEVADVPVVVVHLTCKEGYDVIAQARKRGQKVYVETCPQYLLMDDSLYELPGFESAKYVCAPPLRKKEDQDCLWKGLADGTIQTVSTDVLSENPAKLYGLYPRKGVIAPGSDADLVIMRTGVEDVITAKDQVQNVDYAPFEGTKVTGRVESVFLRGLQAVKDGKVVEEKKGEFLKRGKYAL